MKTINATLLTHLALETTTTCYLVKVVCVGTYAGTVLGFTNTNTDLAYDDGDGSVTYVAENGFAPRRIAKTSSMGVDNSELDGVVTAAGITEAMIRSGLFDGAKITVYRVNFNDLTSGRHEVVDYGKAGETVFSDLGWRTEFRSLSQWLKQPISQAYSKTCIAKFGTMSGRWACMKAIAWAASGTVTSVGAETDRQFTDTGRAEATGYFDLGVVEWLTGDNAGAQMEVDTFAADAFALALGMPFPIQVGDTYRPRLDCDKTFETCRDVHANTDYFRGQNKLPMDGTAMVPGAEITRAS